MKFTAVCVVALLACQAYAWGPIGHEVAAAIAMKHLSSAAVSQLQDILSAEKGAGDLVQVANWADQVRSQSAYKWSAPLHFINTPDWECAFTPDQDCSDNMCVSGAIGNYSSRVVSMDGDEADEAAKFITHFCGDIHQPLHVSFASDRGGNDITGTFFGDNDNLHYIWDTAIIQQRLQRDFNNDQSQYVQYLVDSITKANVTAWSKCFAGSSPDPQACANAWGSETAGLACTYAYSDVDGSHIQDGFTLGEDYYQRAAPIVDMQLQAAGVRMGALFSYLLS